MRVIYYTFYAEKRRAVLKLIWWLVVLYADGFSTSILGAMGLQRGQSLDKNCHPYVQICRFWHKTNIYSLNFHPRCPITLNKNTVYLHNCTCCLGSLVSSKKTVTDIFLTFYRAQCTTVQSAVLLSHVVCPSVTMVDHDHIGWKSWKPIVQTISPTSSLFAA